MLKLSIADTKQIALILKVSQDDVSSVEDIALVSLEALAKPILESDDPEAIDAYNKLKAFIKQQKKEAITNPVLEGFDYGTSPLVSGDIPERYRKESKSNLEDLSDAPEGWFEDDSSREEYEQEQKIRYKKWDDFIDWITENINNGFGFKTKIGKFIITYFYNKDNWPEGDDFRHYIEYGGLNRRGQHFEDDSDLDLLKRRIELFPADVSVADSEYRYIELSYADMDDTWKVQRDSKKPKLKTSSLLDSPYDSGFYVGINTDLDEAVGWETYVDNMTELPTSKAGITEQDRIEFEKGFTEGRLSVR